MLVFIKGLGIGGAERLIAESAPYWDRERFDYRVAYVLPWKDQLVPELEQHGIEVRCLGSPGGIGPTTLVRLRRMIRQERVDLVHAHLPTTGIAARLASPVPVVYTEHNLADSYRWPTRPLNQLTYRRNRAAIAVSEAVAATIAGFGAPVHTITNGVSARREEGEAGSARRELGITPDRPLIVHVGNIRPHKGHRTLLAMAADLTAHHPEAVVVSIGAEKQPGELESLRAEALRLGLADRLRFLGRREDARSFIAAADVYVNPADVEGLPVSILEALALRRPVVATAVGGVPSVVRDGLTGLLVEAGDPHSLAAAVERLLRDRQAAAELARRGQELVEQEFGIERMVRAQEAVYREVLGG